MRTLRIINSGVVMLWTLNTIVWKKQLLLSLIMIYFSVVLEEPRHEYFQ